ncbi:phosphatase PAP2 family protein [Rhizobium glycinendophyticum]|uniref:Phosphatase PAP2 family protein n=1 Tax=Rhizobium glycinendophyticum TaxID=2589807 RepID=A0A504UI91_9HYPH|nr:phosphatase PAP2 family protein [Rhizobium glycinendophyticum]TPP06591.1 phosphatase PAP2 family protein [Rhizobium glycinendophyticum]
MQRIKHHITRIASSTERRVWMTALVAALVAYFLFELTGEVLEGETRAFDEGVLLMLRDTTDLGMPVGPAWLTKMMVDITALGGVTVLTLLVTLVVVYLALRRKFRTAIFVTASILGGWGLSSAMKIGIARPRPEVVQHLVEVTDMSFPSGHAMLSAITYLTLGAMLSRIEEQPALRYFFPIVAVLLTLLIGLSRIYLGVHYPTDVVGGWAAGMVWACGSWFAARWLLGR